MQPLATLNPSHIEVATDFRHETAVMGAGMAGAPVDVHEEGLKGKYRRLEREVVTQARFHHFRLFDHDSHLSAWKYLQVTTRGTRYIGMHELLFLVLSLL